MKYCIIYNKNASSGRKSKFIKKISDELSKYNDVSFFETESVDKAEAVFKNISKLNIDRLVVAGGDGSVSFAINKLIKNNFVPKKDFAIGYIPAGTANLLQAELNMSKKISKIVQILQSNNLKQTNLVKINNDYFILMAGIGWDATIVHSINSSLKKLLGKIIFGYKGLQKFLLMKNQKLKVNIDGQNHIADWVLCSNTNYYAGHYKINKTNIFDNKIITYVFKDLTRIKILYYIYLIIFFGDLSKSTSVITSYSSELKIDGQGKKIPIQIDGDKYQYCDNVELRKSRKYFNILTA